MADESAGGVKLDAMFTLHPALATTGGLFTGKQAHFAHAVATAYRDRSHFDGQNMLEGGGSRPYGRDDGWVDRKSVVEGKSVSVRVVLGGRRIIKKKNKTKN